MKPVWFRFYLANIAIASATFAVVDLSLWVAGSAPAPIGATSVVMTLPEPSENGSDMIPRAPLDEVRSVFVAVGEPGAEVPSEELTSASGPPVLRGIVVSGAAKKALIAAEPGGEGVWVQPGDRIAGVLVEAIQPRRVFLRRGGDRFWISLATVGG
ncbi:MAG: hypothetical protein AAF401_13990 [Pseudomonadota bacterium]